MAKRKSPLDLAARSRYLGTPCGSPHTLTKALDGSLLMSGIAIAFAVVGWALFGVTLLSVVCDWGRPWRKYRGVGLRCRHGLSLPTGDLSLLA
jgi:hypothetical protein